MNQDTHVYCTNCRFGEELILRIMSDETFVEPTPCVGCYAYNPEDSVTFQERPHYQPLSEEN